MPNRDLTLLHIVVAYKTFYRLARARTGGHGIPGQRVGSSLAGLSAFFSILQDEMLIRDSFKKIFLTKLSYMWEWEGELKTNKIKWYTDDFKINKEIGLPIFRPRTKYSWLVGTYANVFQEEANAVGRCAQVNLKGSNDRHSSEHHQEEKNVSALVFSFWWCYQCITKCWGINKRSRRFEVYFIHWLQCYFLCSIQLNLDRNNRKQIIGIFSDSFKF